MLARIEAFGFSAADDPLGFESRLADEHGWTLGYALAVAEEYRRFLVLTQLGARAASPSPYVDAAWHLHLTRTVHYEAFCAEVFGRFLHHEPARPGDGARHRELYRDTLLAYRRTFGFSAPSVTWPRPDAPAVSRAAVAPGWTVPGFLRRRHRLAGAALIAALAAALLLRNLGLLDALQAVGPFEFLAAALLATLAFGWLGLRPASAPAHAVARDRLDPYEAAWFSGGAERMAMTAIVALTERGVLLAPGKPAAGGARPPIPVNATVEPRCVHPAEVVCLRAVTEGGLRFTVACLAMAPLALQFERRLVAAGVASDVGTLPPRRARALLGMGVLLAIELERIFHAAGRTHPIGFLVLLTLVGVALTVALSRPLRRTTARSERVLRPLRLAAGQYKKTTPSGQALAFGVALIGGTAMADDLRFDGLKQQVNVGAIPLGDRRAALDGGSGGSGGSACSACSSSDGGSSCSSGDGGSSCSSGCGGGGGD